MLSPNYVSAQPIPAAPAPVKEEPKKPVPPKAKVGDAVEAVWPVDGKWHQGKVSLNFGQDFFLVQWTDDPKRADSMVSSSQIRKAGGGGGGGMSTNTLIAAAAGLLAYTLLIFLVGYWSGKSTASTGVRKAALASVLTGLDHRLNEMRSSVGLEPPRRAALQLSDAPYDDLRDILPPPADKAAARKAKKGAGFQWWHALLGLLAIGGAGGAGYVILGGKKNVGERKALEALQEHDIKHADLMKKLRSDPNRFSYGLT